MSDEERAAQFVPNVWAQQLLAQLQRSVITTRADPNPKTLHRGIPYRWPYRTARHLFARILGALIAFGERRDLITVHEDGVQEWKRMKRYDEYPNPDYDPTIPEPTSYIIPRSPH